MAHGGINLGNYFASQGLGGGIESSGIITPNKLGGLIANLGEKFGLPSNTEGAAKSLGVGTPTASPAVAASANEATANSESINKALASMGIRTSSGVVV